MVPTTIDIKVLYYIFNHFRVAGILNYSLNYGQIIYKSESIKILEYSLKNCNLLIIHYLITPSTNYNTTRIFQIIIMSDFFYIAHSIILHVADCTPTDMQISLHACTDVPHTYSSITRNTD